MEPNHSKEALLSAEKVRKLFHYDPETGALLHKLSNNQVKIGQPAGELTPYGYRRVKIGGKSYMAHRLIWFYMTGKWAANRVDHKNGNRDDNRFCNLREATDVQNKRNEGIRKDNQVGIKGVSFHESGRFQARIYIDGRHKSLGLFATAGEAAEAYRRAAQTHFGEFARTQ